MTSIPSEAGTKQPSGKISTKGSANGESDFVSNKPNSSKDVNKGLVGVSKRVSSQNATHPINVGALSSHEESNFKD